MCFIQKKSYFPYRRLLALLLLIVLIAGLFPMNTSAAPPVKLQGKVFHDMDMDGILDAGESFGDTSNGDLTGLEAVLTSPSGAVSPINISIEPNGGFNLPDTSISLSVGTYQLTIINHSIEAPLDTVWRFTPTTVGKHSVVGNPPFGMTAWYMDIPQGTPEDSGSAGIAADQSYAVYNFEVTANSAATMAVGIGLVQLPTAKVTFAAGSGIVTYFGQGYDPEITVLHNAALGSAAIPSLNGNVLSGYDPDSIMWTLDKPVTIGDSNVIAAGTPITSAQLAAMKTTENVIATANLSLAAYDIIYDYAQGTPPDAANPTSYESHW